MFVGATDVLSKINAVFSTCSSTVALSTWRYTEAIKDIFYGDREKGERALRIWYERAYDLRARRIGRLFADFTLALADLERGK